MSQWVLGQGGQVSNKWAGSEARTDGNVRKARTAAEAARVAAAPGGDHRKPPAQTPGGRCLRERAFCDMLTSAGR
jgi:hypothetical protein